MHINKIIGITITCLAFAGTALGQGGPQGQASGDAAPNHNVPAKFDYGPVFDALDTNHDGKVAKEEWLASGLSQHTYDNLFIKMIDTNKDLVINKTEFTASSPQFEVDTDKDGKVSLREYIAANNGREAIMKASGGSTPPATDHGGAQGGAAPAAQK